MAGGRQIARAIRKGKKEATASTALADFNKAVKAFETLDKARVPDPVKLAAAKLAVLDAGRAYRMVTKKTPPGLERFLR